MAAWILIFATPFKGLDIDDDRSKLRAIINILGGALRLSWKQFKFKAFQPNFKGKIWQVLLEGFQRLERDNKKRIVAKWFFSSILQQFHFLCFSWTPQVSSLFSLLHNCLWMSWLRQFQSSHHVYYNRASSVVELIDFLWDFRNVARWRASFFNRREKLWRGPFSSNFHNRFLFLNIYTSP